MSRTILTLAAFGFMGVVSACSCFGGACSQPEPEPVYQPVTTLPAPISVEPVYTGKYK